MKPLFHPQLVNDARGDPVLYIDFLFDRRALLMDLGDLQSLSPKRILRISDIFVSHTHMDHFIGFDHVVRILLGRERAIKLYGPRGLIEQVGHKLAGYTWNLVENYESDFTLSVTEMHSPHEARSARYRCRKRFQIEEEVTCTLDDGVLLDEDAFRVRAVELNHGVPCLAFALEEKLHINVWKNRLDSLALPTGPWLKDLKAAVLRNDPDDLLFVIWWYERGLRHERRMVLGDLRREILRTVPGQKVVYVVDALDEPENTRRIVRLANRADALYIESFFLQADTDRARNTCHLTAARAGRLGREAGVKRLIPIHFSARYEDRGDSLRREALEAFENRESDGPGWRED